MTAREMANQLLMPVEMIMDWAKTGYWPMKPDPDAELSRDAQLLIRDKHLMITHPEIQERIDSMGRDYVELRKLYRKKLGEA